MPDIPDPQPRWLLAGATGRIGRMLMRHWAAHPPAAARIVAQSRHAGPNPGLVWDLRGPLPAGAGPLAVMISLAGVTPGPGADLALNLPLAVAVLEAALRTGTRRVLLASSSAVYGRPPGGALRETDPTRPLNPYGEAKVMMEAACAPFRERGLEVCCLRIGNVAGADVLLMNGARATAETPLRIDRFADGDGPRRSYVGPATLARVLESLARHPQPLPPVLNIAAPRPVGMADLATEAGMGWGWTPAPAAAVQDITLDCSGLARLHAFAPADNSPAEMVRQWTLLRDPP